MDWAYPWALSSQWTSTLSTISGGSLVGFQVRMHEQSCVLRMAGAKAQSADRVACARNQRLQLPHCPARCVNDVGASTAIWAQVGINAASKTTQSINQGDGDAEDDDGDPAPPAGPSMIGKPTAQSSAAKPSVGIRIGCRQAPHQR